MTRPYSFDSDDDPRWVDDVAADDRPAARPLPVVLCRRCRRPVASSQTFCTYCGAEVPRPRGPVVRAVPVARPPADDAELLYGEPVDVDDPLDDVDEIPLATVVRRPGRARARPVRPPTQPAQGRLGPMFAGYVVMLAISIAYAVLVVFHVVINGQLTEEEQNWSLFAIEMIDALLVLGVAALVGHIPPHPSPPKRRTAAWIGGFPVLAVLLVLNISFTMFLRQLFQVQADRGPGFTLVTALLICLQPAVVEEWFFRHLALGSLREKLGLHWGVVVSGAMFAFAHLYNPVGMPYLFLLGVALGYLRVWSRSLLLPMILHFAHNAAVLLAAQWF
jgi:membrane protease YdiL (CAAX protease family)